MNKQQESADDQALLQSCLICMHTCVQQVSNRLLTAMQPDNKCLKIIDVAASEMCERSLPASLAGFIAANRRKPGWRCSGRVSPRSLSVMLLLLLSSSPAMHCSACKKKSQISSWVWTYVSASLQGADGHA